MHVKTKKPVYEVDQYGLIKMSKKNLKIICHETEQYNTAYLNDELYLHMRSFNKIENLEDFTEVKTLYLHSNKISTIENLEHLKDLCFLYLQNNCITRIQNLPLANLKVLNLSNNQISVIENLSLLVRLESLNLSQNELVTAESIKGLAECPSLKDVDLSKNAIPYGDILFSVFGNMPNLRCLILKENPLINEIPSYRKKMICVISSLTFLDNATIKDDERRLAKVWLVGGNGAIFKEKMKIYAEKKAKEHAAQVQAKSQKDKEQTQEEKKVEDIEKQERDHIQVESEEKEVSDEPEKNLEEEIQNIGKHIREQVEKEFATRLEEPLRKKATLLKHMPVGYQVILARVEAEISQIEKEAQRKEDIIKERMDKKIAEITKLSVSQADTEKFLEKKREFQEYIERKNLIWLINQPRKGLNSASKTEEPVIQRAEKTQNVTQAPQEITEDIDLTEKHEDFIKSQYMEFHKIVDMMDQYIANINEENWTLGDLIKDVEFRRLFKKINEIASYFNTQAQNLMKN